MNSRRQQGWAGLIMILIVVVIIGLLASTLLKQMLGISPDKSAKSARGPGAATTLVDPGLESSTPATPANAIERARGTLRVLNSGGRQAFLSVACGDDLVAFGNQPDLQDLDVGRIVVDDEDARRSSHRRCPSEQCNIRARAGIHKDTAADQRAILIQKFFVSGAS